MEQTFKDMLEIGDPIELKIFEIIKQVYPLSERLKDDSGDIDTHSQAGIIEIKSETVSEASKRYMVEVNKVIGHEGFKVLTKPSGLNSTKSKYWIQVDASGRGEMYIILTTDLRKFIADNHNTLEFFPCLRTNQGGYTTDNQVYFLPKKRIVEEIPYVWAGYLSVFNTEHVKTLIV